MSNYDCKVRVALISQLLLSCSIYPLQCKLYLTYNPFPLSGNSKILVLQNQYTLTSSISEP